MVDESVFHKDSKSRYRGSISPVPEIYLHCLLLDQMQHTRLGLSLSPSVRWIVMVPRIFPIGRINNVWRWFGWFDSKQSTGPQISSHTKSDYVLCDLWICRCRQPEPHLVLQFIVWTIVFFELRYLFDSSRTIDFIYWGHRQVCLHRTSGDWNARAEFHGNG